MKVKVKIDGVYNILGRGWVLCINDAKLSNSEISCDSTITTADGKTFEISGIGKIKYDEGWYGSSMEINLIPNNQVENCFHAGQEIEINI